MLKFDIIKRDGLARAGVIHTPHGDIKTPAFIGAATKATVKALTMKEMRELGSQAILANTYHLILAPGSDLIEEAGGVAKFSSWHGPMFTDSGGFQIFSLPDVKITEEGAKFKSHINGDKFEMTPESSMQDQWKIGADIHMAFDHLTKTEERKDIETAMHRTHQWLDRCVDEHNKLAEVAKKEGKDEQFLYAVVQGGTFNDLRAESAKYCASKNPDGFGIGGVFVADRMDEMLKTVNSILPENKPRHLLGMGQEPIDLFVGVEQGIDTFDCVAPTRMARNGSLYTLDGRINIKNAKYKHDFTPLMEDCDCECCRNYNKVYLHHLFKTDEITAKVLASIHNERFVVRTVDNIREALLNDSFQEYKQEFLSKYYRSL
ncbi:tRNA guanosine(34) transglycosylase Tgt [Candidatus Saccharibacteria bacterium]|nr:tRNA guanosine(34) transglycosylase Tgt [Candidatus Saccharibacteria bacterium]